MADTPLTVDQYRLLYTQDFPELKNIPDEQIAMGVYSQSKKQGQIKDTTFDEFKMDFLTNRPEDAASTYRAKYEKQFPQLKELTDAQIANKIYDQRVANGEKLRFDKFVNKFAPKEYVQEFLSPDDTNFYDPQPKYTVEDIAKLTGIDLPNDVKTNANDFLGPKLGASFGQGEKNKVLAYKNSLSKFYNQDVDVRVGPKTGEPEFLNPQTGKYTLINQPGFDAGDMASFAGDAVVVVPQVVGNILGFAYGGPGGAILGGAGGAGLGEAARDVIGRVLFDVNKDTNAIWEGTKQAGLALPFEVAGVYGPRGVDFLKKLVSTGKTNVADLEAISKNAFEAKVLMDKMNDEFAKRGLKNEIFFTLGQAADDPKLLAIQNAFERQPKYGFQGTYSTMNKKNAEALDAYFKLINESYGGKDFTPDQVGVKINQVLQNQLNPERQALAKLQQDSQADLTSAVITLPSGSKKEAGQTIRTNIQELQNQLKDGFEKEYTALYEAGKGRYIGTDLIKKSINEIDERQRNTLFTKYPDIKKIINLDDRSVIALDTIKNTRTDLKAYDRLINKGAIADSPEEGAVKKVLGALDQQLKKDLQDDPWLLEYNNISNRYKAYKDRFKGAVGDMLEMQNGRLKLADEDVFGSSFKYGKGAQQKIDAVYDVIKERPDALNVYKNSILDQYKKEVVNADGSVNTRAHDKFIKNYEYGLKTFFGENNYPQISKIGELGKEVNRINVLREETLDKLSKTTIGKLEKLDPDLIFSKVYDPAKPTTLKETVNILKNDPDTFKAFQNVVIKDIQDSVTSPTTNAFDYTKFASYLKNNKQNLQTTFADDPKYIKNLEEFNDTLKILSRRNDDPIISQEKNALNDLIRARVGMFTLEGRLFTSAQKIFNYRLMDRMNTIITDPKALETLLSLKNVPTKNYDLYNSIVYGLFGTQFSPETLQPKKESIRKMESVPSDVKFKTQPRPKAPVTPVAPVPVSEAPAAPNTNIFAANTPNTPITTGVAPTTQPVDNTTVASAPNTGGLTNIPQDQLNKYNTLFGPVV
jgi:hypothetical protein